MQKSKFMTLLSRIVIPRMRASNRLMTNVFAAIVLTDAVCTCVDVDAAGPLWKWGVYVEI